MPIERSTVEAWLREDLGHHDVTNHVPGETTGRLVVREAGVVAGLEAAAAVFEHLDVAVTDRLADGDAVEPGEVVLAVSGPARDVLRGERAATNVVAHASGVATRTRRAVAAAREVSESVRIAGTRKTTPGLRGVEKRAIAAGGGDTHRLDLSHMAMVKDNHVAELGLEGAIERVRERTSFATLIEVEAEDVATAREAALAGADAVLLDNMAPETVERAVATLADADRRDTADAESWTDPGNAAAPGSVITEASGGITLETVREYAATGVDVVSMGSLTHSAPSLDHSFRTG
ncbi:carboxylating nicotinate-nucleotide diphosphorylase [Halopenitus persicus]|uniref:Nicotinate-nucleotide pyrophosphorylase [carboxylating] n=1 Tax=Halopenitus persicus TaxID=1048396 RepID=A0A1H3J1X0_9EURY|nr:carboxylating nicotinate-nucleotide diphosphorylase [Halopenitus persicus]QHS17336.1 carboxylating nicotinate-nucleotide diphosphorylase [haloarchaeon 3A1-DGR]SDY33585.1 nicotinate-nucleotide pyrophosphorylase [carboxylating] [Halopenitus persicus]